MKIAYVAPRYAPHRGGVETHVAQLACHGVARGYQVEVLAQESDRGLPAVEVIDGVTVRRFWVAVPSWDYAFAPGLWAYLARHCRSYDVVHAHSYHALPSLGAAMSRCHPLVFTPHYHGTGHSPLRRALHVPYRWLGAIIFKRSSRVICVSEAEAALVRRHFPRARGRVTIIPNGVDVLALHDAQPYPHDRAVILTVGRLEAYKNVDRVVDALAHLDETYVLRVIGDGPARLMLQDRAHRLGLQGRVAFLGPLDDAALHRWFRTARIYVSMSSREAFGITLLEALAAGAAVVATDIPAHREVASGTNPHLVALVPLGATVEKLARTVQAMATCARVAMPLHSVPSWETVAAQTIDVYRALTAPTV